MDKAGQTQDMKRLEAMPEAIINIQTVIRRLAPIHESLPNRYLGFKLETFRGEVTTAREIGSRGLRAYYLGVMRGYREENR